MGLNTASRDEERRAGRRPSLDNGSEQGRPGPDTDELGLRRERRTTPAKPARRGSHRGAMQVGLARTAALHHRASTLYQIY